LDGIVRSFRKTSNQYRILYHDGEIDDLTEEALANMLGVTYPPLSSETTSAIIDDDAKMMVEVEEAPTSTDDANVTTSTTETVDDKDTLLEAKSVISEAAVAEIVVPAEEEPDVPTETVSVETA
jgi:hypothetical protein